MQWECAKYVAVVCMASTATMSPVFARQYLNIEEVKQVMFGGELFVKINIFLGIYSLIIFIISSGNLLI